MENNKLLTIKTAARFLTVLFLMLILIAPAAKAEATTSVLEELVYTEEEDPDLFIESVWEEDSYSAILYDNTSGMPTSEANDIVETPEGFIWIGTYGGLIRYDGNNFESMSVQAGITSVRCLHVDQMKKV